MTKLSIRSTNLLIFGLIFKSGSQFVIPEGQGEHRGKMETSFTKIGAAVCGGGLFGGMNGLYQGFKDTSIATSTPAVRRTM